MTSPDLFKFLEQTWRPWMVRLICCGRDDGKYQAMTWEEADQFRESYTSGAGVASHWSRPWEGHVRSAIITEWPPVYVPPEGCTCMSPHSTGTTPGAWNGGAMPSQDDTRAVIGTWEDR